MTQVVFLDTGVLGLITHPQANSNATKCVKWLHDLLEAGIRVCIPEVCDYELRREYLRRFGRDQGARSALGKLDGLKSRLEYIEIKTNMMVRAAEFWAASRNNHTPTADPKELDVDVILAAQAEITAVSNFVIATTNVGHLARFGDARAFADIGTV